MLNITFTQPCTKLKVTVVQKRFLAFSIIPANYAFQVFHDVAEREKNALKFPLGCPTVGPSLIGLQNLITSDPT